MASNYQVGNLELRITSYANAATQSLGKMNTQLDKTRKTLKNVGIFATFGKLNYMTNMMRYYGRAVANVVQYAMDYVETLNLWQVANRENIDLADEFIAKMNKAYGVSERTLMNYQAIFKNMLAALGDLSDAVSSQLSMQLTQMALDFSSLYNVTIERAMTVYQSILSGQVRPVRSISGMDITENTIFDLYQQAGGEKTVRQLSQIEKRLLRIAAIFNQMGASGAIGDMEKTIESASNQARVMSEQLKEGLTWTGQIILLWLNNNKVFQYINAALMTMKEIVKSIAFDLGYEEQNFLDGMITQAENADEALDEVQGKLLSFDKFEALNSADSNVLGIDPVIEDLIANINLGMDEFKMKATEISEEWLKMLNFEYNAETGLWEMNDGATSLLNTLKTVGTILAVILGVGLSSRLLKLANSLLGIKDAINLIFGSWKNFGISAIITLLAYAYVTNEDFRKSLNLLLTNILTPLLNILNAMIPAVTNIIEAVSPIIEFIAEFINNIVTLLDDLGILEGAIYLVIGAFTVWQGLKLLNWLSKLGGTIGTVASALKINLFGSITSGTIGFNSMSSGAKALSLSIGAIGASLAYIGLDKWFSSMDSESRKLAGGLTVLIGTVVSLVTAFLALQGTMTMGVAIPIILTAVGAGIAGIKALLSSNDVSAYANGGFPEEGQLFIAREAGAEMVGSMGGRTTVANNDQIVEGISQGVYEAVISANSQNSQQLSGNVYIDGSKVGKVVARPVYTEGVRIGVFKKA